MVEQIFRIGGGKAVKVSWNDADSDGKIDKGSEQKSAKVEVGSVAPNNSFQSETTPNTPITANQLSSQLFQLIDRNMDPKAKADEDVNEGDSELRGGQEKATPDEITSAEMGNFLGHVLKSNDDDAPVGDVIERYNHARSYGTAEEAAEREAVSGSTAAVDRELRKIDGKRGNPQEQFNLFEQFAPQHASEPEIIERAYLERISGNRSISGLQGNPEILKIIAKGYLNKKLFEGALRVTAQMSGDEKKQFLLQLVEAARDSAKQADRRLAARAVRILIKEFPGQQLEFQQIKVADSEKYAQAVEYEALIPDALWAIRDKVIGHNLQDPTELTARGMIENADETTFRNYINGHQDADAALARLVLAECFKAKGDILWRMGIVGNPNQTEAYAAYVEMAKVARQATLDFMRLRNSCENIAQKIYYNDMMIRANDQIGRVINDNRSSWRNKYNVPERDDVVKNWGEYRWAFRQLGMYIAVGTTLSNYEKGKGGENADTISSAQFKVNLFNIEDQEHPRDPAHGIGTSPSSDDAAARAAARAATRAAARAAAAPADSAPAPAVVAPAAPALTPAKSKCTQAKRMAGSCQ